MTAAAQTLERDIEAFWEYYQGDSEWRHFYGDDIATIYLHGYENGRCGLRVETGGDEIEFSDVQTAKLYGFAVLQVFRQYLNQTL